jgi:hypothetical protein
MSPKKIIRDLSETPFASNRLIIWTLGISVILSLTYIFALSWVGKDIPPSLTMASGFVIQAFTTRIKIDKGEK